jgi:hypothetical protein
VITRALGMGETLRVPVRSLRALPGDLYLLCSDGLTGALDDDRVETMLSEKRTPSEHVRALVDAALAAGTRDNVAALVVECRETDVAPPRRPSVRPLDVIVRPPPSARAPLGSAPEIIIVGVETHVVPTNSASANVLDALGRLSRLRQPSAPEIAEPKPARCGDCGQPLEKGATLCPMCGAKFAS